MRHNEFGATRGRKISRQKTFGILAYYTGAFTIRGHKPGATSAGGMRVKLARRKSTLVRAHTH